MKLRKLLTEAPSTRPASFEEFSTAINEAIQTNDFGTFKKLLDYVMSTSKFEWFGRFYAGVDRDGDITKKLFKALTF